MKFILGVIVGVVAGVLSVLLFAQPAHAIAPTFSVQSDGLHLLNGETFQDAYHVNLKLEGIAEQRNMHIEAKCLTKTDHECAAVRHYQVGLTLHEEALFIGKDFLPWSALGIKPGQCIEWVQVAGHNYHFGENGEAPVCVPTTPPTTPPVTPPTDFPKSPTPPSRVETGAGS